MSRLTSKCFNDKNNYNSLEVTQEKKTLLQLLMTSNNSQNILKERGSITIVVNKLYQYYFIHIDSNFDMN
jgi:hypothetical protein